MNDPHISVKMRGPKDLGVSGSKPENKRCANLLSGSHHAGDNLAASVPLARVRDGVNAHVPTAARGAPVRTHSVESTIHLNVTDVPVPIGAERARLAATLGLESSPESAEHDRGLLLAPEFLDDRCVERTLHELVDCVLHLGNRGFLHAVEEALEVLAHPGNLHGRVRCEILHEVVPDLERLGVSRNRDRIHPREKQGFGRRRRSRKLLEGGQYYRPQLVSPFVHSLSGDIVEQELVVGCLDHRDRLHPLRVTGSNGSRRTGRDQRLLFARHRHHPSFRNCWTSFVITKLVISNLFNYSTDM